MDRLMSTLKIEGNDDYLFEGFSIVTNGSTKSYLEATLTTKYQSDNSVTSGRSAKAFHQHNCFIHTYYILLENQSTVDVFCNPTLFWNSCASDQTLYLRCNSSTAPVNQVGDLTGYGHVWYHPKGIAIILRLYNLTDNGNYWVRYDSQESKNFIITRIKDGKETRFHRAPRGLHYLETKAIKTGEDGEVLINTIEDNKSSYTRCLYLRAKLARKLQRIIVRPSVKTLKRIIGRNLFTNCPVNISEVSAAEDIFGPDEGSLRGKTVSNKDQEVKSMHANLPMEIIAKYQLVILYADYMFVKIVQFFNNYSCDIKFITSRQQDPKTDLTMQAMKSIKSYYTKRGFKIVELRSDQQFELA